MAIRSVDELLQITRDYVGEDTSDKTLDFISDITDTVNSLSENAKEDWKTKFEQNDAEWRQKFKDRFFNSPAPQPQTPEPQPSINETKPLSYDNLFKV